MKQYTCRDKHYFDDEEVKHRWNGWPLCPHCWPNGFMMPKQPQQHNATEADLRSNTKDV